MIADNLSLLGEVEDLLVDPDRAIAGSLGDIALLHRRGLRVVRELGRGGQGIVYLVEGEAGEPLRAVKVALAVDESADGTDPRIQREAAIAKRLSHPGLVPLLDIDTLADGRTYLVFEFVDGCSLLDYIAKEKRLDLEVRLRLFVSICEAAQHAHENGVLHRDLKPSNVLVRAGRGIVLDFGLACSSAQEWSSAGATLTQSGAFLGSLAWAAPEQVKRAGATEGVQTDVHALGLLLAVVLTGEHPLAPRASLADWVHAIEHVAPKLPSHQASLGAPGDDIDAIFACATSKRPADRYSSAGSLADDVRSVLNGGGSRALAEARRKEAGRKWRLWIVAAGALLGVLAGFHWLQRQSSDKHQAAGETKLRAAFELVANGQGAPAEDWLWELVDDHGFGLDRRSLDLAVQHYYNHHPCRSARVIGDGWITSLGYDPSTERLRALHPSNGRVFTLELPDLVGSFVDVTMDGRIGHQRLSPDGKLLVWLAADGARIHHLDSGEERGIGDSGTTGISFRGSELLLWDDESTVRVFSDPLGGVEKCTYELSGEGDLHSVLTSPNESTLFAVRANPLRLQVWGLSPLELRREQPVPGKIQLRGFGPRGELVGAGRDLYLFDPSSLDRVDLSIRAGNDPCHAWLREGGLLSSGGRGGGLLLWNAPVHESSGPSKEWSAHSSEVKSLCAIPGTHWVVSGDSSGGVRLWDTGGIEYAADSTERAGGVVHAMAFSGETLVLGRAGEGGLEAWDLVSDRPTQSFSGFGRAVGGVALFGDIAMAAGYGGRFLAVNLEENTVEFEVSHDCGFHGAAVDAQERWVSLAGADGCVRLYSLADWSMAAPPIGAPPHKRLTSIAWAGETPWVAAGRTDGRLQWVHATSQKVRLSDQIHSSSIRALASSPTDGVLASVCSAGTLCLWRPGERTPEICLKDPMQEFFSVGFSTDGKLLAAGSRAGFIRIYTADRLLPLLEFRVGSGAVYALKFIDGRRLIAGGEDGQCRTWDLGAGAAFVEGNRTRRSSR